MYKVWKDCCLKAGLDEPSEKHGLDLQVEMKLVLMLQNGA